MFSGLAGSSDHASAGAPIHNVGKPFLKLREGKLFLVETERVTKPGESVAPPFVRARQQAAVGRALLAVR